MSTFIEYELEDGTVLYIEAAETEDGLVQASRDQDVTRKAEQKLEEALVSVKKWACVLFDTLHDLEPNETEVKFGVTTFGEAGNFAVGKLGAEVNYEVTLTWKKTPES